MCSPQMFMNNLWFTYLHVLHISFVYFISISHSSDKIYIKTSMYKSPS